MNFKGHPIWRCGYLLAVCLLLAAGCSSPLSVDSISVEFLIDVDQVRPMDRDVLVVRRIGDTSFIESRWVEDVFQGETGQLVRRGTFDVDKLFQELLGQLVDTWDTEEHVGKPVGTVRIFYNNDTSGTYFMYDAELAEELFKLTRDNLVEE